MVGFFSKMSGSIPRIMRVCNHPGDQSPLFLSVMFLVGHSLPMKNHQVFLNALGRCARVPSQ